MSNITPDQLAKIADLLDESVQAINAYQIQNLDSISGPEHILINNKESEIMAQANKIRNEAIILTIENSAGFLEGIEEATEELKSALSTIKTVSKVIQIAASVVALGLSISTANASNIQKSLEDIVELLKDDEEEDE
jgi:cell division protein ZapA (FtsZ GTPase activity inhibitor)